MPKKDFEYNYIKKTIRKPLIKRVKPNYKWLLQVGLAALFISMAFALVSEVALPNFGLISGILIIVLFIVIGFISDIIGVAIMVADIERFHSLAAKKIRGAKLGIKMIKNKEKVASFSSDVVGDVSGIVSGVAGLIVAEYIITVTGWSALHVIVIVTAIIATITITGKAICKPYATNLSNHIIYELAKILSYFYKAK